MTTFWNLLLPPISVTSFPPKMNGGRQPTFGMQSQLKDSAHTLKDMWGGQGKRRKRGNCIETHKSSFSNFIRLALSSRLPPPFRPPLLHRLLLHTSRRRVFLFQADFSSSTNFFFSKHTHTKPNRYLYFPRLNHYFSSALLSLLVHTH